MEAGEGDGGGGKGGQQGDQGTEHGYLAEQWCVMELLYLGFALVAKGYSRTLARVSTSTLEAPARRSTVAHSCTVEPVV